jgi:DNA-binding GntR family transcriptional regulator
MAEKAMERRARSGRPRYLEIARILEREIARGKYPVGSLLPTERALCSTFGVSRYTVREALRRLRDLDLVSRRQGSGTQVITRAPRSSYTQSFVALTDLLQYAKDTSLRLGPREEVTARGALARLLGASPGQRWLKYAGVRYAREAALPICTTDVYIRPAFAGIERRLGRRPGPIYILIEDMYGEKIAEVVQHISAVSMPVTAARTLGVGPGSPALRIVRRYLSGSGQTLEASVSLHRADRFIYSMRIRRDGRR